MPDHVTEKVRVGDTLVDVDIEIIPVVLWLNDLAGCRTMHSCQGETWSGMEDVRFQGVGRPYLVFSCGDPDSLRKILGLIRDFCSYPGRDGVFNPSGRDLMKVEVDLWDGVVRYDIRWPSLDSLRRFSGWIGLRPCSRVLDRVVPRRLPPRPRPNP